MLLSHPALRIPAFVLLLHNQLDDENNNDQSTVLFVLSRVDKYDDAFLVRKNTPTRTIVPILSDGDYA